MGLESRFVRQQNILQFIDDEFSFLGYVVKSPVKPLRIFIKVSNELLNWDSEKYYTKHNPTFHLFVGTLLKSKNRMWTWYGVPFTKSQ